MTTFTWETREQWGAQPPRARRSDTTPRGVAIHYPGPGDYPDFKAVTAFDSHDRCRALLRSWQRMHKARGSNDIEYGLILCQHLRLMEARIEQDKPWVRVGSNGTREANTTHNSIQLMRGTDDPPPTNAEIQALGEAVAWLRENGNWGPQVTGHRDHYATACPGDALYRRLPDIRRIADATTFDEKDWFDMATKKDLEDAVRAVVGDAVWSHDVNGRPAGWWQKQTHGIVRRFLGPVGPPTSKVSSDLADLKERLAAVEKAVAVKEPLTTLDEMKAER